MRGERRCERGGGGVLRVSQGTGCHPLRMESI